MSVATVIRALTELRRIVDPDKLRIIYKPHLAEGAPNQILIGLGDRRRNPLAFNPKGTGCRTVSRLVWNEPELDLPSLVDCEFVVEDASPDSCLAFILLLAKAEGAAFEQEDWARLMMPYLDYVERWEGGDVRTTGMPFESWGCLHNALSHGYLAERSADSVDVRHGFLACVRFTLGLLERQAAPDQVPAFGDELYMQAAAFLERERQQYAQSLQHADLLQLSVPIRGSGREFLVDAYIATEREPLGSAKAFLRNDKEHAHFGHGFSLMAVHRPEQAGTGNDMVVSVDPTAGIYLYELWARLEHMENERWEGKRPNGRPRFPDVSSANQPWYHEMGRYGLVAAPKQLNGEPGTKLNWDDVTQAIWELYHPARGLKVHPYDEAEATWGASCDLTACPPAVEAEGKRLVMAKWDAEHRQSALWTPTLRRMLAALAASAGGKLPGLDELPPESSFDVLEMAGGIAVIHEKGVLLLDDWSKQDLSAKALRTEFDSMLERFRQVRLLKRKVESELAEVQALIEHRGFAGTGAKLIRLSKRLAAVKLQLRQALLRTMPTNVDASVTHFRERLEQRWAVQAQLEELYTNVAELEQIMKNQSETRTNYLIGLLTIYGFPFALVASFFGYVFDKRFDVAGLAAYFVISTALLLAFLRWDKLTDQAKRRGGRGIDA